MFEKARQKGSYFTSLADELLLLDKISDPQARLVWGACTAALQRRRDVLYHPWWSIQHLAYASSRHRLFLLVVRKAAEPILPELCSLAG